MLVDQKLGTQAYQVSPADWERTNHREVMQRLHSLYYGEAMNRKLGVSTASVRVDRSTASIAVHRNPLAGEMRRAVNSALSNLSAAQGRQMMNGVLATLRLGEI